MRRSTTTARSTPPPICSMRSRTGTTGACEAVIMTIKIDRKIVKYQVQKPEDKAPDKAAEKAAEKAASEARAAHPGEPELVRDKNGHTAKVIRMHERLERPEMLIGSTYKIKTPISAHAMYVTINDIVLNEDTEYEQRRPFEVFINSKNLDLDRLHRQDQDADLGSRHVRDHQRHRAERGHRVRAAPPVRGFHQLQEPRSLPVDRGAHAHHLGGVPQRRRRHLPGG